MRLWIARDKGQGAIHGFTDKPVMDSNKRFWRGELVAMLSGGSFPELTFENSPMQVEIKLIEK